MSKSHNTPQDTNLVPGDSAEEATKRGLPNILNTYSYCENNLKRVIEHVRLVFRPSEMSMIMWASQSDVIASTYFALVEHSVNTCFRCVRLGCISPGP